MRNLVPISIVIVALCVACNASHQPSEPVDVLAEEGSLISCTRGYALASYLVRVPSGSSCVVLTLADESPGESHDPDLAFESDAVRLESITSTTMTCQASFEVVATGGTDEAQAADVIGGTLSVMGSPERGFTVEGRLRLVDPETGEDFLLGIEAQRVVPYLGCRPG